jgi:hypothetical protein
MNPATKVLHLNLDEFGKISPSALNDQQATEHRTHKWPSKGKRADLHDTKVLHLNADDVFFFQPQKCLHLCPKQPVTHPVKGKKRQHSADVRHKKCCD